MKSFFDEKVKEIANAKKVLDIGGGSGFQKGLAPYKTLFSGNYTSIDYDASSHPDVVGDAQNMPFHDGEFDGVLCISVLEHVPDPQKVVDEMHRVLSLGGKGFIYAPFLYPYHAKEGVYEDFFRFTPDGIRYLFRNFTFVEMHPARKFFEAWLNMLPKIGQFLAPIGGFIDKLIPSKGNQASGFNIFVIK